MVTPRIFGFSLLVTVVSLAVGYWYAGLTGLFWWSFWGPFSVIGEPSRFGSG